jgi:hypothetical protein
VEEGIVAGGGTALVNGLLALDKLRLDGNEWTSVEILRRALEEPLRQIAFNAGAEGSVVVAAVCGACMTRCCVVMLAARAGAGLATSDLQAFQEVGQSAPCAWCSGGSGRCHGRRCPGCEIIAVNGARCVTKSAKPHAPWRPAAASRSATAVGARRGKTGNTGRKTRGLQYCGHRAPALSGTHQGGRTVPRLGTVGPS